MSHDGGPAPTVSAPKPLRTEVVERCPVCGSKETSELFRLGDMLHGVAGTFCYQRCRDCDSVFQSPRVALQDLAECYPSEYFTHDEPQVPVATPGRARRSLREAVLQYADNRGSEHSVGAFHLVGRLGAKIPPIRRRARYGLMDSLAFTGRVGDRCLEVGFGQARELRQLAYVGWDAFGIDVDPKVVALAERYKEINVRTGTLIDCDFPDAHFALIYSHHALEHLPHMRESLVAARRLLRPGGRFVAVYPNPRSLGTRVYGPWSVNWDPPRHLILPSRRGIEDLLTAVGFDSVRCQTRALKAAFYSRVARHYRQHPGGNAGLAPTPPGAVDHMFAWAEKVAVAFSAPVGEEIVVDARRA